MPEYTEQIVDRELRISLYDNEAFASAEYRKRVQVIRDGEPVGKPEWQPAPITQEALQALLGEAAVTHRDHVTQVEAQIRELRITHAAELQALRDQAMAAANSAAKAHEDFVAEANAAIAERNAALQQQAQTITQLNLRVAELDAVVAEQVKTIEQLNLRITELEAEPEEPEA